MKVFGKRPMSLFDSMPIEPIQEDPKEDDVTKMVIEEESKEIELPEEVIVEEE
jgi:hypothetical protein